MNLFPENMVAENDTLNSDFDFKSIVDISPYPIFIHKGGIIKYANQFSKTMIGAEESEDITGINIAAYCHPDDLPTLKAAVAKVHLTWISDIFEFRMIDRQGNVRRLQSKSTGINFGGEICRLVHVYNFSAGQYITDIKSDQGELINYKAFQEKINSTSPVLVTVFDIRSGTTLYSSQDMAQWFNYTKANLPQKTMELVHHEYREEALQWLKTFMTLKDGEISSTVFPLVAGDGSIKFMLSRGTVFQRDAIGQPTQILLAHSDVTDLKEIESKLDKSEETRKAILYAIPDMVVIARADGTITDFYPNELYRSEFEAADFIGKNLRAMLNQENYDNVMRLISQTLAENKLQSYTFEQGNGAMVNHFELRISPFSKNEVIVLTRDISDQKDSQNKIDHYNKELFQKNQELERYITSNSELEKFAYIASHDLREPLRSLTGFAQLLQKRNQGHLTRESEEFIENIIQGAGRMNTLVSGLLEYSRIASVGKPFTNVNVTDLIKKVRSDLKISIEENQAEFILFDMPELYCDELQVRQLFQNLISNAIKFRSERAPIIKISAEQNDRHWLFKVEDNGIGIDMKFKDQVFQIFSRLHAQDKYQGSGIGLSVCKKILERHGGQIWLESTPGRGTTIFFTILI